MASSTSKETLMRNKYDRIVLLIDMDCFYCQVEEKLNPQLRGHPLAVVQYNAWRGGGIIAVNYAARAKGVTRHMRGDEAKAQCANIELVKVPNVREKADLSKYRDAGKDVANVLQQFTTILERASVDEAYLDITQLVNERLNKMNSGNYVLKPQELLNTYAVGYDNIGQYVSEITARLGHNRLDTVNNTMLNNYAPEDLLAVQQLDIRLLIGASISNEIRAAVKLQTEYECSAGIAHNKILAKLACGMNKPNKQTILPLSQIPQLFDTLPLGKIKGLGGKFGEEVCERANITFIGQLRDYTEEQLQRKFDEKNGTWLYYICRGIDFEAVTPRFYSKSIGCCKRFPGRNCITGLETLQHWLHELAGEIVERLEKDMAENSRRAKQMVVSFTQEFDGGKDVPSSRSIAINNYDQEYLEQNSLELIKANTKQFFSTKSDKKLNNSIKFLGISIGKFETITRAQCSLQEMFAQQTAKQRKSNENINVDQQTTQTTTIAAAAAAAPPPTQESTTTTIKSKYNTATTTTKSSIECLQNSFFANYLDKKDKSSPSSSLLLSSASSIISENIDSHNKQLKTENQLATEEAEIIEEKNKINNLILKSLSKQIGVTKILTKKVQNSKRRANEINLDDAQEKRCKYAEDNEIKEEDKNNTEVEIILHNDLEEVSVERDEQKNNYQANYAEFDLPEISSKILNFITCDECHKEIPADERSVQLHKDHHYAFKLSQQLRQEYKQTKNNNESSNNNRNKLIKKLSKSNSSVIKNNNNKSNGNNITKFLKPISPIASTSSSVMVNCDNTELCTKCHKLIEKSILSEHLDFHMAMEVQKEVNKITINNDSNHNTRKNISSQINNNNKKATATKEACGLNKPITKFFTKP